MKNWHNPPQV